MQGGRLYQWRVAHWGSAFRGREPTGSMQADGEVSSAKGADGSFDRVGFSYIGPSAKPAVNCNNWRNCVDINRALIHVAGRLCKFLLVGADAVFYGPKKAQWRSRLTRSDAITLAVLACRYDEHPGH